MQKILFLIHDLGPGGAEKVLINLVNNMDKSKFDITVHSLFDEGVNKQFLAPHIHYIYSFSKMFRGNSKVMKLLSPRQLHKWLIKASYDIEVAYLEGPCARIISGCENDNTRLVAWIHSQQKTKKSVSSSFRNMKETEKCYNRFHRIVCVAETLKSGIMSLINLRSEPEVYYNTNESEKILRMAEESVDDYISNGNEIKMISVGKLVHNKGYDRILRIVYRLRQEGTPIAFYILGVGPEENALKNYVKEKDMENCVTFLGYQTNPYKYVAKSDVFVCSSFSEGFSTAATEALIVGTPVCTVEVSGMKEMLGENNEYGIVTENDEEALYRGIKSLIESPELLAHYKKQAEIRGKDFSTEQTVRAVEEMLEKL